MESMSLRSTPANPDVRCLTRNVLRVNGGTGFLVRHGNSRVVLTASHVLRPDLPRAMARSSSGGGVSLNVLGELADLERDLAALGDHSSLAGEGLRLADEDLSVGDEVWSAGFPAGW